MTYTARTFTFPELKGISKKQMDIHIALYEGYVKHTNLILEKIEKLKTEDADGNAFLIQELRRRLAFEFDGMRTHEYYFSQLEGGATAPQEKGPFMDAVTEKYGTWENFIKEVKAVCGTRGIGWTIVYYDHMARTLHTAWVMEHMNGQYAALPIMLAIDMWEHAYMVDYMPSEKTSYVDAFLENMNWDVVEKRFLSEVV
jgi:Fe-Mn family superoxide dismutase